jgi:hypothetical protein
VHELRHLESLLRLPKVLPFRALPYFFGTFTAVIFSTPYPAYYQKINLIFEKKHFN